MPPGGVVATRETHTLDVAGSIPAPVIRNTTNPPAFVVTDFGGRGGPETHEERRG